MECLSNCGQQTFSELASLEVVEIDHRSESLKLFNPHATRWWSLQIVWTVFLSLLLVLVQQQTEALLNKTFFIDYYSKEVSAHGWVEGFLLTFSIKHWNMLTLEKYTQPTTHTRWLVEGIFLILCGTWRTRPMKVSLTLRGTHDLTHRLYNK